MGLFDKLFNKSNKNENTNGISSSVTNRIQSAGITPCDPIPTVNLRNIKVNTMPPSPQEYKVNLSKVNEGRVNLVKVTLQKRNVPNLKARIVAVMDDSYSMCDRLHSGLTRRVFERVLPLALELDDNGSIESYILTSEVGELPAITIDNIENYVLTYFSAKGGTDYEPTINAIAKHFGEDEPSSIPTLVLFFTDGDANKENAARALIRASRYNIFFQFIGLGSAAMETLEQLDGLPTGVPNGRLVDNADFFRVVDINKMSDDDFYAKIMNEFPTWLEAFNSHPQTVKPVS